MSVTLKKAVPTPAMWKESPEAVTTLRGASKANSDANMLASGKMCALLPLSTFINVVSAGRATRWLATFPRLATMLLT
jgi:hypothetical protein